MNMKKWILFNFLSDISKKKKKKLFEQSQVYNVIYISQTVLFNVNNNQTRIFYLSFHIFVWLLQEKIKETR